MSNGFTPHEQPAEDIRRVLRSLDPIGPEVPTPQPSRDRLEDIMATSTTRSTENRSRWLAVAAAVAVMAVGVGVFVSLDGSGPSTPDPAATPLELNLGDGGVMASCLPFEVEFLAQMPVALEGTVTAIRGETVTLGVDHWYAGGDASTVELHAPAGMQALIGGIDFVEGQQYLISASEGAVSYCGYSGPSTGEFRAAFDQAFGG